ncbi:MAG TPA: redoxin domain-containing protein [Thermomicrobiales bacterium]|nr:redoxin domain-containing protein [Thermomicrobiales bacterium]
MSDPPTEPTKEPAATAPGPSTSGPSPNNLIRLAAVLVIVGAIVGTTWLIGERQGFGGIGDGGVNSNLIPKVGEMAPDLVTFDTNNNLVRLSDLRGQPVWLNFWGSWCQPCRAEFPDVEAAYQTLHPQDLVMLGIAVGESPYEAQDYADRVGGTFPVLADPAYLAAMIPEDQLPEARALVTSYTINNYPTHIFINRDGTVGAVVLSPMSYDEMIAYGEAIIASPMPEVLPATPES